MLRLKFLKLLSSELPIGQDDLIKTSKLKVGPLLLMADIKIRFLSQMTKISKKMAEDGMNMDFRNSKHMEF